MNKFNQYTLIQKINSSILYLNVMFYMCNDFAFSQNSQSCYNQIDQKNAKQHLMTWTHPLIIVTWHDTFSRQLNRPKSHALNHNTTLYNILRERLNDNKGILTVFKVCYALNNQHYQNILQIRTEWCLKLLPHPLFYNNIMSTLFTYVLSLCQIINFLSCLNAKICIKIEFWWCIKNLAFDSVCY